MEITLSRLGTKNLATLAKRAISISEKPEHTVVKDNPLLVQLQTVHDGYNAVYAKNTYSGMGSEVETASHTLNAVFGGIRMTLLGNIRDTGAAGHQESVELYGIIQKHGTEFGRYSYSEETARMEKLVEEFDLPANVAKIEKTRLTENVARLKNALADFNAIFGRQVEANAALRRMESASSLRHSLESALRNYFNMAGAMRDVDGWKALYTELNEAVKAARNSDLPAPEIKNTGATEGTKP